MNIGDRQVCDWCKHSSKNYHVASTVHKSNMGKYIGKEQAEEILMTLPTNSIMLRGHCYGQYYISKLKANNIIEHIPILLLGSYYFCMGIRFPSLSEIVRFHSCGKDERSTLSGFEFLNASILEDMGDIERFITLYDLELIEDQQLPLLSGDIISRIGTNENNFVCARNERTGQMGSVHTSLLCPVIEDDNRIRLPYFHHQLTAPVFNDLKNGGKGTFLIKRGSDLDDYFVLLVNVGAANNIQQFLIRSEFSGYLLCGRRFASLGQIVNRYCGTPIFDGVTLTRGIINLNYSRSNSSADNSTDSSHRNYEFISNLDVFWKMNKSDTWSKGCLSMWKENMDSDTTLELKANEVHRFSKDSVLFPVDDPVFGSHTCMFIRNASLGIYINFRNIIDFIFCCYCFKAPVPADESNFVSFLSLSFHKLRSNKIKQNRFYSAHCSVDNVDICSSPIIPTTRVGKIHTSVVFDQIYMIPYVQDTLPLKISINAHAEMNASGQSFLSFPHKIRPNGDIEDRNEMLDYHLQVHRVPVLESCCYESFNNWLLNCPLAYLFEISDMMTSHEKNFFCVCVISHFLFRRKMLYQMLRRLMTYSLETSSVESILRQDSLTTTFLSQLLQILCRTEFIELVRDELNDNGNEALDDEAHITLIIKALNDLVSQNDVLRNILVVICQTAQEFFTDSLLLSRKIISVILVLRFACPLLLKDKSFPPSVIKQVQMIANKSLSASETDSETVLTFRDLFDGISKFKFKEECSEFYTFPWHGSAALACFLLFTTLSKKPELSESLSKDFKNLIYLHNFNC